MLSRKLTLLVSVLVAAVVLTGACAQGGIISFTEFNSDASSGISAAKTYTHKIDMGVAALPATINTVEFTTLTANGNSASQFIYADNFIYECSKESDTYYYLNSHSGGGFMPAGITSDMGIYNMLYDMIYPHGKHDYTKLTLTGLHPGATYDLRVYYRPWTADSTRKVTWNFDVGNDGLFEDALLINEDEGSVAKYMSYVYTADSTGTLVVRMDNQNRDTGWHFYGLTNEVKAIPEPSTLALLAAGLVGLIAYAWRKRK
jgi:hypothetical protein